MNNNLEDTHIRITNVQHLSLHDGPGIRTTVFLKGCNLVCPWCANPECISHNHQNNIKSEDISLEDLEKEILKDEIYYSINDGGVTFSGGEPFLQIKNLKPLLKSLKDKNIHICFETALMIPTNLLKDVISYIDILYVDIKILDENLSKTVLKGNLELYYQNLDFLKENNSKIVFRIPLIDEYTFDYEEELLNLLKQYPSEKIELFKLHNLAESKYQLLNKSNFEITPIDDEKISNLVSKIKKLNENTEVISI